MEFFSLWGELFNLLMTEEWRFGHYCLAFLMTSPITIVLCIAVVVVLERRQLKRIKE